MSQPTPGQPLQLADLHPGVSGLWVVIRDDGQPMRGAYGGIEVHDEATARRLAAAPGERAEWIGLYLRCEAGQPGGEPDKRRHEQRKDSASQLPTPETAIVGWENDWLSWGCVGHLMDVLKRHVLRWEIRWDRVRVYGPWDGQRLTADSGWLDITEPDQTPRMLAIAAVLACQQQKGGA